MSPKEQYRQLCQTEVSIPIFSRDWWLDIVCGKNNWDVLLIYDKNGYIEAAMPLYFPMKGMIVMPVYTQTMGPWISPSASDAKYTSQLSRQQMILGKFADALKNIPHFLQNFSWNITDWLPFYWAGFKQTTRYTYILNDLLNLQTIWDNMSPNIRRNILKAEKKHHIIVKRNIPIDEFLHVQSLSFQRQKKSDPRGEKELRALIEASQARKEGDIWGGYDENGRLHAAIFVVWQKKSAYYIAGGGDPEVRASGAHSFVMWTAIRELAPLTNSFDFEGSMLPGVERFFREFGAQQKPYFAISKGSLSTWNRICIRLSKTSLFHTHSVEEVNK